MDLTQTIRRLLNGKKSKTDIVSQLYKIPKKDVDVEATEFTRIAENKIQFIDTLYLPNDKGFQYALVIVDQGSRKMDMEPMKERKSSDIVTALKKIYRRKILLKPIVIVSDVGAEFHKDFQVEYSVPNNGLAKVKLMSLSGEVIHQEEVSCEKSSMKQFFFKDDKGIKPGVYLFSVAQEEESKMVKLIKRI